MEVAPSPLSDPRVFLRVVVRPNIAEWSASYSDLRLALNAIHSVDAFSAHVFWWGKNGHAASLSNTKDDTAYRAELASRSEDFRLLRDVAKAIKHVNLTKFTPLIAEANQLSVSAVGYGEGAFGEGRFGGPPQVVVRSDGNDRIVFMESLVEDCLSILEAELEKITYEMES